jgi:adenylate cyclase
VSLTYEDLGEQVVRNIEEPIRAYRVASLARVGTEPSPEQVSWKLPLPNKPSIAVLPFVNMGGDPEQDYFADGVVEEIISALSRVRSFFVVARNSTFAFKGKPTDIREVSRALGVRYVLVGSVRKGGDRLRISAQLIDGVGGDHVWADRYEGNVTEIFDLQDRVTEAIVGAIEPTITLSEITRAKRKRPDSLDAYDCVMRGLPAIWSQDTETIEGGLRLAERASELDPTYALPKAVAAWCYAQRLVYFRTKNFAEDRARAITLAQEAVRLNNNDPLVLTCAGAAYSLSREFALALALIEKALALDSNSAWAWHRSGFIHVFVQRPDVAIQHFERALRLSPLDPLTFNIFIGIGVAHFHKDQFVEAAAWVEKALREKPDAYWANRILSASYFYADRLQDAERALSALRARFPEVTISYLVESTPGSETFRVKLREAFRALGVPE